MVTTETFDLRYEIAFIDLALPYWQTLAASLPDGVEVIFLDAEQDGVRQMAGALQGRTGVDAIHILSHGSSGALYLGSAVLDLANLPSYESALQSIGQSLGTGGDLLLYGCDVAAGDAGQAFIAALSDITTADVAASSDPTGSFALGGDWDLEASVGSIETTALAEAELAMPAADNGLSLVDSAVYPDFLLAPMEIVWVNSGLTGTEAAGWAYSPQISADGRYVVFESSTTNLVPGGDNGWDDVYVKDLSTGFVARVSTSSDNLEGNRDSTSPAISADGRYAFFDSWSSNLVAGDSLQWDVFAKSLITGATTLVSTGSTSAYGHGGIDPAISNDGRYLAFASDAYNLVSGDTNGATDVFVKDLVTGETRRVSTPAPTGAWQGDGASYSPDISSDGRYVVFLSDANNLVSGDTNYLTDVFVKDLATGLIGRVSTDSYGTGIAWCGSAAISGDGRYVVFDAISTEMVHDGATGGYIYRKDLMTWETIRVDTSSSGVAANYQGYNPTISSNGKFVAFESSANNLVPGDTNNSDDIFVKDLVTGEIARVSVAANGAEGNGDSRMADITPDGHYIVFQSEASNLRPSDTNGATDIFRVTNPLWDYQDAWWFKTWGGAPSDVPVVGNFDGVGGDEYGVYRVATAEWFLYGQPAYVWGGGPYDIPVVGDYNGDGRDDFGVYRVNTAEWWIVGQPLYVWGGGPYDTPVVGDFNGDGVDDFGVYRVNTAEWWIVGQPKYVWGGGPNDIPVVGDYNGDGIDDFGVYRQNTGEWYIVGQPKYVWGGGANDTPVVGDFNGDGRDDFGVYRSDTGQWLIAGQPPLVMGGGSNVPMPADYDGDGITDYAVYDDGVWGIDASSDVLI